MAQYKEYKDSEIPWIGKVPSHWEVKTLRAFLEATSDKGHSEMPLLSVTREKGIIPRGAKGDDDNNNVIPEDLSNYKLVNRGDFVINKMKSWQGSYGLSEYDGIVSPAYFTYKLNFKNKQFFSLALRSKAYIPFFMQFSKGIRVDQWDLKPNAIKEIPFFVPPADEQAGIVAYLDKVTADIDKAIAAKEQIISALEERRKIIITEAVTRGINPDAPLRDSGIDWLGKIPAHWECTKLKYLIRIKSGEAISNSKLSDTGEYPVYGGGEPLGMFDKFNVTPGMILLGRVGARCGCVTLLESNSWATDNALVISPINISVHYLNYILIAADLNKFSTSNAQPLLTGTKVKNIVIALPSPKEQCEIIDYISNKLSKVNSSISQQRKAIDLLRERKSIIINEVVTGKVKVV